MQIYLNWRPLSTYTCTQDEYGVYHKSLTYGKVLQHPLDFDISVFAGMPVTLDVPCVVKYRASNYGNYIEVQPVGTNYRLVFVHVYNHAAVGTTVPAGGVICRLATRAYNGGYAVHLHTCATLMINGVRSPYFIRNIIFAQPGKGIHKNMNVKFTSATNIRTGNGLQYPVQAVAKPGAVAYVQDGPRTADGYRWFDVRFTSGTGWAVDNWMIETGDAVTSV